MKTQKYIPFILVVFSISIASCGDDFINRTPQDFYTPGNAYTSKKGFEAALTGVYGQFQSFYGIYQKYGIVHYFEIKSDDVVGLVGNYDKASEFQDDQLLAWGRNIGAWNALYEQVKRANLLLDQLNKNGDDILTSPVKNRITGEALFLRSLDYFYAVNTWGDVPLVLKPQNEKEARQNTRNSVDKIYAQIEKDLKTAIDDLPLATDTEAGRASKGAAQTLMAKVLLMEGKKAKAEPFLKSVVNSGVYTLDNNGDGKLTPADYAYLWEPKVNFAPSSIFEISYAPEPTLYDNNASNFYIGKLTKQGAKIMITPETRAAFEGGDARRDLSMYQDKDIDPTNYFTAKYVYDESICANNVCSKDWLVFRYADVLLMLTEVTGDPQYANKVRERSGLLPKANYTIDDIIHERRAEFVIEDDRWFTLKRTGKLLDTLNAKRNELSIDHQVQKFELLWPIPQQAIDSNPNLKQNPGYPQ